MLFFFAAPNPPRNLDIIESEVTATSVSITWDPPLSGVYDGFSISVIEPDGSKYVAGRVRGNVLEYVIDGLKVDTEYDIEVVALAGYNSGQECPSDHISETVTTGE